MTANRIPRDLPSSRQQTDQGFTLIELMVVVAILAVLLSLALPAFQAFVTSNRLTAQINALVSDISLARNESATRSRNVGMCIAASSTTCATSGSDWAAGRLIWADLNGNGSLDTGEVIIKSIPALDGDVTLTASGPANLFSISFRPYGGISGGVAWTFALCSPGEPKGRQVSVPTTGRATAKRIETCS